MLKMETKPQPETDKQKVDKAALDASKKQHESDKGTGKIVKKDEDQN